MNKRATKQAAGATPRNTLPPPEVRGLQPDNGDGQDNLLPIGDPPQRLPVIIPKWEAEPPSAENPHKIELKWNDAPAGDVTYSSPVDLDNEANRTLEVATRFLVEGVHRLQYLVKIGDSAALISEDLILTIDTSAPVLGTPNALVFPPEVQDGVTEEYLKENQDQLKATLPLYQIQQPDDVITAYWDSAIDDNTLAVTRKLTATDHDDAIELVFEGALIRAQGAGDRMVRYQVRDRAGNKTEFSDYITLKVMEEAPEEELLDPPMFRDEDIADREDNTLFKDVITAGTGLVVLLPEWENPAPDGASDVVQVSYARGANPDPADFKEAVSQLYPGPILPGDFPLRIVLPQGCLLPDGPVTLRYLVTAYNDAETESSTATFIADTTPPFRELEPPAPTVPDVPITDDYFDNNEEGVVCTLPPYADWQPKDRVVFWWLNAVPDDPTQIEITGETQVTTEPPFTFIVPADAVRSTGDGGCYLVYTVIDKATNRSRLSVYAPVAVALGTLPSNLQDPVVAQAADDGQVGLDDAHAGVIVGIPRFENWKATDRIEVTWGDTVLAEEQVGSSPAELISILVPTSVLKDEYGDTEGPLPTNVSYRILRGDVGSVVKAITVDVDLSVIGPELPEWPDPENPTLEPAAVYGAKSNQLNQLTRDDTGEDARCDLTLYAPVNAGEVLKVYWGEPPVEVAEYVVQAGDTAGDVVPCTIKWEHIEAAGNAPELPVYYTIGHPDSPNTQRSPITKVSVNAVVIVLPLLAFLKQSPNGWLNCDSLDGEDHAVLVHVPDISKYVAAGDVITLTWTPLPRLVGDEVLHDAIKEEDITLDADHPAAGFVWRIQPYAAHLAPTYDPDGPGTANARGRVHYALTYKEESITSPVTESKVGMFNGTGGCDVTFMDDAP
jgi:hypothetical protein